MRLKSTDPTGVAKGTVCLGQPTCHPPLPAARRYEIDKLTASQRLDLNLEKGRMRDELQSLRDKTNELEIKVGTQG